MFLHSSVRGSRMDYVGCTSAYHCCRPPFGGFLFDVAQALEQVGLYSADVSSGRRLHDLDFRGVVYLRLNGARTVGIEQAD